MVSMTGYAFVEKTGQDMSISVEIKGYNNRYMEISIYLPAWLSMLEKEIHGKVASVCGRGKIDVYIRIRENNTPVSVSVNINAAKAYYDAINTLANELKIDEKPEIGALLKLGGIFDIEKKHNQEDYLNEIEPLLQEALVVFCAEREREGKHTEEDIMSNLEIIEASVKTVSSYVPVMENGIKENIRARFAEALGSQVDENKVLAETASLLLKYTISEEISRLDSHLKEFRAEAMKNTRPGKKLDFLCQEINREINTIGSKSAIIEVSGEVVKMKEALENIREQLRNVE